MCNSMNSRERKEFSTIMAAEMWRYARSVASNEQLIKELGFRNSASVTKIVIAIRVGDRLHPTHGFDYLGPDWRQQNRDQVLNLISERDNEVDRIFHNTLVKLETEGYDSAVEFATTASRFQVVHLSQHEEETRTCIANLLELGLATHELCDNHLEKCDSSLVAGYFEAISYFELDQV